MYDKKGQISLFIIIGIILVMIVSFVFFLVYDFSGESVVNKNVEISDEGIKMYVQNCLDKNSNNMVSLLSFQGGYVSILEDSFIYDIDGIYFYINYAYDSSIKLVSKEIIEQELSTYIGSTFRDCVDFSVFEQEGYEIESSVPEINVVVSSDNVVVDADFPITVTNGGKKQEFDGKYKSVVNARLGHVYDIVGEVVDDISNKPEYIHTSFLNRFDVKFDVLRYDESTDVYMITDVLSDIDGAPLVYMFGVKR